MPPVVAAPVGGVPGTRQVVWQVAACELHAIMQFVTIELCARRVRAAACVVECHSATANPPARTERANPLQRMMHSLYASIIALAEARGNVPARSRSLKR